MLYNPLINAVDAKSEYNIDIIGWSDLKDLDTLILAVNHEEHNQIEDQIFRKLKENSIFIDVKSHFNPTDICSNLTY